MLSLPPLFAATLICAVAPLAAHADTINFNLTSSNGTYTFSLPSTATPDFSTDFGTDFPLPTITFNGQPSADGFVLFYTVLDGGGFFLTDADESTYVNEMGPQVFSGTTDAPVFTPGSVTFDSAWMLTGGSLSTSVGDVLTITSTPDVSTSPVPIPEPATLALLGTGSLGLVRLVRRRDAARA